MGRTIETAEQIADRLVGTHVGWLREYREKARGRKSPPELTIVFEYHVEDEAGSHWKRRDENVSGEGDYLRRIDNAIRFTEWRIRSFFEVNPGGHDAAGRVQFKKHDPADEPAYLTKFVLRVSETLHAPVGGAGRAEDDGHADRGGVRARGVGGGGVEPKAA